MSACTISTAFTPRSLEIRVVGTVTPHEATRVAELLQVNGYYGYDLVIVRFNDARATPRGAEILTQALRTTRERGTEVQVTLEGPCSSSLRLLGPHGCAPVRTKTDRMIGFHAAELR